MPVRTNRFGKAVLSRYTKTRSATHDALVKQRGTGFDTIPPTSQWSCGCGALNTGRRDRCRGCGKDRA